MVPMADRKTIELRTHQVLTLLAWLAGVVFTLLGMYLVKTNWGVSFAVRPVAIMRGFGALALGVVILAYVLRRST